MPEVIPDDFAQHYGHLPVLLASTPQILATYTTGDGRGWEAEEADLDITETIVSVQRYGIVHPITLGTDGRVLDGHHRLLAARHLGIDQVLVRLAPMPKTPRVDGFKARYRGTCDDCDGRIAPGDLVAFNGLNKLVHVDCPDLLPKAQPGETSCPQCFLIHPEGACDL